MSSPIVKGDVYIPLASPAILEEGSAPDASPKSSRWSKIYNWCKAHENELIATVCIVAGIALIWGGILAIAAGTAAKIIGSIMLSTGTSLTGISLISTCIVHFMGKTPPQLDE